jgi:hypothetical protein
MLVSSSRLFADPISLNNGGGNQSAVNAGAIDDFDFPGTSNTNDVNSLPYTTALTVSDGTSTSTTTPNLTTSALTATFAQTLIDGGSATNGSIDIFFKANSSTTYSISGTETVVGNDVEGELYSFLYDQTTGTTLYGDDETFSDLNFGAQPAIPVVDTNTLNLAAMGNQFGSATGSLTAGDSYEFYLLEDMDDALFDPTLNGSGGITFAAQTSPGGSSTPLPRSAPAALLALIPMAGIWMKRRHHSANSPA